MVKTSKGKKQLASLLPSNNVEKVTRRSRLSDDAVVNDIDVNADRPYLNEVLNDTNQPLSLAYAKLFEHT